MSEVISSNPASSALESPNNSPGTILRRCREFHGITIEEASETTKIGISHLRALEEDQIREFANKAYLKGFLRIYATYLGLNSDDIARMYEKLFGVHGEKPDPTRAASTPDIPPQRWKSLKKMIVPAFILAVIVLTATFFKLPPPPLVRPLQPAVVSVQQLQNSAVQLSQSSTRIQKSALEIPTPPHKAEKLPAELPDIEKPVLSKRSAETTKGFILKVKVIQAGTMTATVDGDSAQQYELTIGDVIEWKAEKKVALELSNAGGVDVELNGKSYKSLGPLGKPAYVELDADGIKQ